MSKRWLVGVAVAIVLASVAAMLAWFVWLPTYRPDLRAGERYGIDVSHHQGPIDWRRVAQDDISFAYIKATEGADFVDNQFALNWTQADAAGLTRGAYHFFTLCTAGQNQAENFLQVVPDDRDALPPAVDLELAGNCRARPDRVAVERELSAFLQVVEEATGDTAILYVGDDFEELYGVRASFGRPLWHRRFLRRPNVEGWVIWQVSGFAKVNGVRGRVDLNISREALADSAGPPHTSGRPREDTASPTSYALQSGPPLNVRPIRRAETQEAGMDGSSMSAWTWPVWVWGSPW